MRTSRPSPVSGNTNRSVQEATPKGVGFFVLWDVSPALYAELGI